MQIGVLRCSAPVQLTSTRILAMIQKITTLGERMGNITDRQRTLQHGVEKGLTLVEMAKMLPRENGHDLSRQRIHQLLRKFGLMQRWTTTRLAARQREHSATCVKTLAKRAKGRQVVNILRSLQDKGYSIQWDKSTMSCSVNECPVTFHIMNASFKGRYHANSSHPNTLRICVFPTGKIVMIPPNFELDRQTLNFKEEVATGQDELIPPKILSDLVNVYMSKQTRARLGRLSQLRNRHAQPSAE